MQPPSQVLVSVVRTVCVTVPLPPDVTLLPGPVLLPDPVGTEEVVVVAQLPPVVVALALFQSQKVLIIGFSKPYQAHKLLIPLVA